jgi:hypothetical protein
MSLPTKDEQYQEVVHIVKMKNKRIVDMENGGLDDEQILLNVKEVEQTILNYCQVPRVPSQLNFVWANMTVDLILYLIEMNNTPEDPMDGLDVSDLSSIKVGDTSVYIGDKYRSNQRSRLLQSHNSNLDELVMNYTKQLNQFRRIL